MASIGHGICNKNLVRILKPPNNILLQIIRLIVSDAVKIGEIDTQLCFQFRLFDWSVQKPVFIFAVMPRVEFQVQSTR